jgi:hypothetical protein
MAWRVMDFGGAIFTPVFFYSLLAPWPESSASSSPHHVVISQLFLDGYFTRRGPSPTQTLWAVHCTALGHQSINIMLPPTFTAIGDQSLTTIFTSAHPHSGRRSRIQLSDC